MTQREHTILERKPGGKLVKRVSRQKSLGKIMKFYEKSREDRKIFWRKAGKGL